MQWPIMEDGKLSIAQECTVLPPPCVVKPCITNEFRPCSPQRLPGPGWRGSPARLSSRRGFVLSWRCRSTYGMSLPAQAAGLGFSRPCCLCGPVAGRIALADIALAGAGPPANGEAWHSNRPGTARGVAWREALHGKTLNGVTLDRETLKTAQL